MHPNAALESAQRELELEDPILPVMKPPPPPAFLHFAPRVHQRRRTMTGVLAGYFDPPRLPQPIPKPPGVATRWARTVAPREEVIKDKVLKEKKQKSTIPMKKKPIGPPPPSERLKIPETRAKSPVTSLPTRAGSFESTPPLTPISATGISRSEQVAGDGAISRQKTKPRDMLLSKQIHGLKPSSSLSDLTRVEIWDQERHSEERPKKSAASAPRKSEPVRKLKRTRSQMEDDSASATATTNGQSKKRKSRPGWKGWVEVEESSDGEATKLIRLDDPVELFERKTRSGKVKPGETPAPTRPNPRRASAKSPSHFSVSVTPAPAETSQPLVKKATPRPEKEKDPADGPSPGGSQQADPQSPDDLFYLSC